MANFIIESFRIILLFVSSAVCLILLYSLVTFGVPWSNNPEDKTDRYLRDWYGEKPYDIIVCPGNHSNYNRIEQMPREIYFGAWARRYSKNIVLLNAIRS